MRTSGVLRNIFRHYALSIAGHASADGRPVVQPFDFPCCLFRDAGECVEVKSAGYFIDQIVEEGMAVEVVHDLPAKLLNDSLGIFGGQ